MRTIACCGENTPSHPLEAFGARAHDHPDVTSETPLRMVRHSTCGQEGSRSIPEEVPAPGCWWSIGALRAVVTVDRWWLSGLEMLLLGIVVALAARRKRRWCSMAARRRVIRMSAARTSSHDC